jgi:hypothetical protein
MPIEPPKPKCKVCQRVKQEANRWFRVEPVEAEARVVGMRWSRLEAEDLLDPDADFVCGPGCLARETSEIAQKVIEEEPAPDSAHDPEPAVSL